MSSNINFTAIDAGYPIAGQDNNTQGFRDNFNSIKTALAVANAEVSTLQSSAVLTTSLTDNTAVVNDLNLSTITNGYFAQFHGVVHTSVVAVSADVDLANGPYQAVTLSGNATLRFTNWPVTGNYGLVRVAVKSNQLGVWYPTFSSINAGTLAYAVGFGVSPVTGLPGITVGGEGVTSINVSSPGSGYTTPITIGFTGGNPMTNAISPIATATYTAVSASIVGGSGGTGFTMGDTLVCNVNSSITVTVTGVSGGIISTVSITTGGVLPSPIVGAKTFTALTGSGTGAKFALSNGIGQINMIYSGNGYVTTPPTVTYSTSVGVGTAATAVLTSQTGDNTKVIDAWTVDGGVNVFIKYVGEF